MPKIPEKKILPKIHLEYSLVIRTFPNDLQCDCYLVKRSGTCPKRVGATTAAKLYGHILLTDAEELAVLLGLPVEHKKMPYTLERDAMGKPLGTVKFY